MENLVISTLHCKFKSMDGSLSVILQLRRAHYKVTKKNE